MRKWRVCTFPRREWAALVRAQVHAVGFQEESWSTIAHGVIVPASRHWISLPIDVVFLLEPGALHLRLLLATLDVVIEL